MRRSICYCEPKSVHAGHHTQVRFTYSSASHLPKGTRIKFDPLIRGREFDWEIPTVNLKAKNNQIWIQTPSGQQVAGHAVQGKTQVAPIFEFVLPEEIKPSEEFSIVMGCTDPHSGKAPKVQSHAQRKRAFNLFIDPKGKGDYKETEVFYLDVKGSHLDQIRIITPSLVNKNERFNIVVRFEDAYGNLTSYAPEGTLIELSYDQLRENLNWKLFVPETGFINLPNLYFNESGIYRIKLLNTENKKMFFSSPIKCMDSDESRAIYWGVFHGESERFDSTSQVESCLRYFRDDQSYHFYGSSPFENEEETSNDAWKLITNQVAEFNEEDRFSSFLGTQWFNNAPEEGLRQLVFLKDSKPLLRKKDPKFNSLKKIYKSHTSKEIFGIVSFSMAKGFHTDFSDFNPEFEPVVEIYNAWGSSECTKKEGNLKPITSSGSKGIEETDEGSIRKALNQNHRFGFVAGGLDDRGIYQGLYTSDQTQYTPGLTAIISSSHSRDNLYQALKKRSCYATTGARMIVGLYVAGMPMGSSISLKQKPGLSYNRYISGYVIGTKPITKIEIIRNGKVIKTLEPKEDHIEFNIDDTEPLESILLKSPKDDTHFVYYYLRATQDDGHVAWGSPIWIDYDQEMLIRDKKVKKKP